MFGLKRKEPRRFRVVYDPPGSNISRRVTREEAEGLFWLPDVVEILEVVRKKRPRK